MTNTVRPVIRLFKAFCTSISDSESSSEVASSRIRIGAFFSSARAMAMRCRWPPLSLSPRDDFFVEHVRAAVAEVVAHRVVE